MSTSSEPTLLQRLISFTLPLQLLIFITVFGLPKAVLKQVFNPSLSRFFSPKHWWTLIFEDGMPVILEQSDKMWGSEKRKVVKHASGVVLEIGAGAGHTVPYYDSSKIEKIIAVEPFQALHPHLRAAVEKAKLSDKYTILGVSIEDQAALSINQITPGSVDTVVCVQVLCSIPNPREIIRRMYELLKPGGQLILFEHIQSHNHATQQLQDLWTTYLGWNALTGCNFNRPSDLWVKDVGVWKEVNIWPGPNETQADLIPHAIGRLIKA